MSLLSPQLQAFMAIVKHKTVHGAADAIHMTQTAVTQRIRTLETRLGTTLFLRSRRGMILTPEGEALLRYCNAVKEIEGEAIAKIKGAGIESNISVCITGPTSIMHSRIIPKCLVVQQKFSNILLHFNINDIGNRVASLRSGESQLAVIQQHEVAPEMVSKNLAPERYVLVCTSAWKGRRLQEIIQNERIVDYDPNDQMTFSYLKSFNLEKYARHDRHFVNSTDALAAMLISGIGYSVLTTEFSKSFVDKKQLIILNSGKIWENHIALAWYPRPEPPKYFSALVDGIR